MDISHVINILRMGCICGKETIRVDGRQFQIKTRLGEGGFSYIDLVEDVRTHRLYALKRINCHSQEDECIAQREVEVHRAFPGHDNILQCEESALYLVRNPAKSLISEMLLVLPYYRRGTLADELLMRGKSRDYMGEDRILRLLRGICEAVKAMHHHRPAGFTHRDIKAANVLLSDDDIPILMDLGSAGPLQVEVKTASDALQLQDEAAERCSMPYRAPELFHVEKQTIIDERIDVWSLGCLLYAMAFFKSPYEEVYEKGGSIALAVVAGKISFPEDHPYSQGLLDLIQDLMRVNPTERPFIDNVLQQVDALQSVTQQTTQLPQSTDDLSVEIVDPLL
ncbi:PREDICTED: serine/threonine-protein kinase 16-like [Priapulus caudatus]|uniref:non-specific serine/threonine protein kinase n=1 Tax=Priapulus caudatus TaxID=37621 RepID=A0ABM1E8C9_PRICU|nr:PREDICTED: serine/threonine-protein kinase 16-like [Priapulus caudatus]XP_014668457.1 PREDICTED: serine/threonine-protein kinase 16-like [Priapulus caudatus]